jgi:ATP-dependent Clp protease protease subunit
MKKQPNKYWILNKTSQTVAELLLYGEISSFDFWGDEVTPKQIDDELKALGQVDEINVRINSPGGEVFAGMAIHAMLTRHSAKINVYVDGLAASIASVIALAGDTVTMAKGSFFMIHLPWGGVRGTSTEMRKYADLLDQITGSMVDLYAEKSGKDPDAIRQMLEKETWMNAEDAVTHGFAQAVEQGTSIAACLKGDKTIVNGVEMDWKAFKNAPDVPVTTPEPPPVVQPKRLNMSLMKQKLELTLLEG